MIAEARVPTARGAPLLQAICGRLADRARANPGLGVRVAWTETNGTIDFGWASCTLAADAEGVTLRAESADADGLRQARELLGRHLEQDGASAGAVTWLQDGKPVADSRRDHRDAMRAFHRRMRRH